MPRTNPFLYHFPETFFVLASRVKSACENKGSPILLAVSKGELCLCCDMKKGQSQPSLELKVRVSASFFCPQPSKWKVKVLHACLCCVVLSHFSRD